MNKKLTANTLKLTAILAMLCDHIAYGFVAPTSVLYLILRTIGKITAPIMCFFIAEGYFYTKNLTKYKLRLLLFAILSHIPFMLYFGLTQKPPFVSSVMASLLLGLIALELYYKESINKPMRYIGIALCFALSINCDWSCMAAFFILIFGIYRENRKEQLIRFSIVAAVLAIASVFDGIENIYMVGVLLAVPLLAAYSGSLGKKSAVIKWGFYVFYPLHLVLLWLIKCS